MGVANGCAHVVYGPYLLFLDRTCGFEQPYLLLLDRTCGFEQLYLSLLGQSGYLENRIFLLWVLLRVKVNVKFLCCMMWECGIFCLSLRCKYGKDLHNTTRTVGEVCKGVGSSGTYSNHAVSDGARRMLLWRY